MPRLIEWNREIMYYGMPMDDPETWYVSAFGRWQTTDAMPIEIHPLITLFDSLDYKEALESLRRFEDEGAGCGVDYIITKGNVRVDPDELDENGLDLPEDDSWEDEDGPVYVSYPPHLSWVEDYMTWEDLVNSHNSLDTPVPVNPFT